jgi:hypothetical protein
MVCFLVSFDRYEVPIRTESVNLFLELSLVNEAFDTLI